MKKYSVGMQLLGYERIEVEAESQPEAFEEAKRRSDYRPGDFQHILDDIQEVR